jgi:hypothetical protein
MYWNTIWAGSPVTNSWLEGAIANDRERGEEMTAFETRERTRLLAGERLNGRVALVTGGLWGIGAEIGRSLVNPGAPGRPGGVARVVQFLCAGACSLITAQVWALNVRGEA